MIFEDCKNCTKNKFNKYDTVINFVENKIGCIEKCVGCNCETKLEDTTEESIQEVAYCYPVYLVFTTEGNLESWREIDIIN